MDLPLSLNLDLPFDQKWEILKTTIERLYVHEGRKLSELMQIMKDRHGFVAAEHQYKYHINKKWRLNKSIPTPKKAALCQQMQKRAELGKASVVTRGGKNVDTKKLRRYLKTEARRAVTLQPGANTTAGDAMSLLGHSISFGNRIFMNWNMPYGLIRSLAPSAVHHVSPLSDISVTTPPSAEGAPSPTAVAINALKPIDRARLFLEGRHNELLRSMDRQQRVTMSTWMYQFWLFSYKTAKHWGRGPQDWTADLLGFHNYHQRTTISTSLPSTPNVGVGTPASQFTPGSDEIADTSADTDTREPSSLCWWSIHYKQRFTQILPPSPRSPSEDVDLHDEESGPERLDSSHSMNFEDKLCDNLQSNAFSNIDRDILPVAVDQIATAARRSPEALTIEAIGFAIMGRNVDLLMVYLLNYAIDLESSGLYPFHLALSYLDGAKTCCQILDWLQLCRPLSLRRLYVNDLGHTVLDQLMIAILKAHTSCLPSVVDVCFKKDKRFAGEDVDICGRWDPDSDCIRTLLTKGSAGIPFNWKHMFCHTSIQTICHCIGTVFGPDSGPNINAPSGLFVRHCSSCGLRMELSPLHSLALVALHLSLSGCKNENLFGILACLLCLLSNGANPLTKTAVSLQALLSDDPGSECNHKELDPSEFAEMLFISVPSMGTDELKIGWQVLCQVLKRSQSVWNGDPSRRRSAAKDGDYYNDRDPPSESGEDLMSIDSEDSKYSNEDETSSDEGESGERHPCVKCLHHRDHFFGRSEDLASLWASIQTELLTYRRLQEGDRWISKNFDMNTLNESLIRGNKLDIALVRKEMMKPCCEGGEFPGAIPACPLLEDVAAYDFSNLEGGDRSTSLDSDEYREEAWYNLSWIQMAAPLPPPLDCPIGTSAAAASLPCTAHHIA